MHKQTIFNTNTNESLVNQLIVALPVNTNLISDGYHTFGELYEHRIELFRQLCRHTFYDVWRSTKHSDGSEYPGWFILGISKEKGKQITYDLPIKEWENTNWAETLEKAPEWDGHTSSDVLERLKEL